MLSGAIPDQKVDDSSEIKEASVQPSPQLNLLGDELTPQGMLFAVDPVTIKEIQDAFVCAVSGRPLKNPVQSTSCGHLYEQEEWDKGKIKECPAQNCRAEVKSCIRVSVIEDVMDSLQLSASSLQKNGHDSIDLMRSLNALTKEKVNEIRLKVRCPLTQAPVFEAATLSTCGHTFEFNEITKSLQNKQQCPLCRKQAYLGNLYLNYFLMKLLDVINRAHPAERLFEDAVIKESMQSALGRGDKVFFNRLFIALLVDYRLMNQIDLDKASFGFLLYMMCEIHTGRKVLLDPRVAHFRRKITAETLLKIIREGFYYVEEEMGSFLLADPQGRDLLILLLKENGNLRKELCEKLYATFLSEYEEERNFVMHFVQWIVLEERLIQLYLDFPEMQVIFTSELLVSPFTFDPQQGDFPLLMLCATPYGRKFLLDKENKAMRDKITAASLLLKPVGGKNTTASPVSLLTGDTDGCDLLTLLIKENPILQKEFRELLAPRDIMHLEMQGIPIASYQHLLEEKAEEAEEDVQKQLSVEGHHVIKLLTDPEKYPILYQNPSLIDQLKQDDLWQPISAGPYRGSFPILFLVKSPRGRQLLLNLPALRKKVSMTTLMARDFSVHKNGPSALAMLTEIKEGWTLIDLLIKENSTLRLDLYHALLITDIKFFEENGISFKLSNEEKESQYGQKETLKKLLLTIKKDCKAFLSPLLVLVGKNPKLINEQFENGWSFAAMLRWHYDSVFYCRDVLELLLKNQKLVKEMPAEILIRPYECNEPGLFPLLTLCETQNGRKFLLDPRAEDFRKKITAAGLLTVVGKEHPYVGKTPLYFLRDPVGRTVLALLLQENDALRKGLLKGLKEEKINLFESLGIRLRDNPSGVNLAAAALVARARQGNAAVNAQQPVAIPSGDVAARQDGEQDRAQSGHRPP